MAEEVCPVSATQLTYGDTQTLHIIYMLGNRQMLYTYTHTDNSSNTIQHIHICHSKISTINMSIPCVYTIPKIPYKHVPHVPQYIQHTYQHHTNHINHTSHPHILYHISCIPNMYQLYTPYMHICHTNTHINLPHSATHVQTTYIHKSHSPHLHNTYKLDAVHTMYTTISYLHTNHGQRKHIC